MGEFKFIRQEENDSFSSIDDQNERWRKFLDQCEAATAGSDSVIIGDCNLDFNCWNDPIERQKNMIEKTKSSIGSSGFHQVITGNTHTWPGARDSLIDHCWVNNPDKVISTINRVDASSDHNIVGIVLQISGTQNNCHSFKKRKWGDFDSDKFNHKLSEIDWGYYIAWTM